MSRGFGSDNHAGAHPRILEAINRVNQDHMPSYGTDEVTRRTSSIFKKHFGEKAEAHFVFNGTAANVLALSPWVRPYHSVFASPHSHLINDECGAPERVLGAKLISLAMSECADGKINPEMLSRLLIRRGDQHYSQARAVSITQPTEVGTLYSIKEICAITEWAHSQGLFVHLDGARLVNAAASLGVSLKAMTTDCGVDVVSLGGTKNGLVFGEAVVFLNPDLAPKDVQKDVTDFKFIRKQLMQLPSKTRFISAQFEEFLGTDLWLENARHANAMAARLSALLNDPKRSAYAQVTQKTQANAVFAIFPRQLISRLREKFFFYIWNETTFEARLMTSWDTQTSDIDRFVTELDRLALV